MNRRTIPESKYVTAGRAAKMLGVHRSRIYQMINAGTLIISGYTPDGVGVFSREYIERIARERRKVPAGGDATTVES